MIQILEYIMQHYTLFLGSAILILLAIIGYYADKTNFGQDKNLDTDENNKSTNIENMRLLDATSQKEQNVDIEQMVEEPINKIDNQTNINSDNTHLPELEDGTQKNEINDSGFEDQLSLDDVADNQIINIDEKQNEINITDNNIETKAEVINEESNDSLLIDENFYKFNEEFDAILPKKELINTDLLSDIDDLELGKTQKIDLSSVPDLDDIELPKIKQLAPEEQDIWKF